MKRILFLTIILIWMFSSSAQALSWAYPFVVWERKVYEVKREEIIPDSRIGKIIGQVKTKPNDMTGDYYGDASNVYPKGTKYSQIKGESTSSAIAVQEEGRWVKAVYVHKAPFHIMNVISNFLILSAVIIVAVIMVGAVLRFKRFKKQ